MQGSFEGAEHLRKPYVMTCSVVFGNPESTSKKCPVDKSKIEVTVSIGSPGNTIEKYQNLTVVDDQKCTKEIVKFSPVSLSDDCKQSHFKEILAITEFNVNMKFERVRTCHGEIGDDSIDISLQMPAQFYDISSRIDHVLSALLPGTIEKLNLSSSFDLTIKLPTGSDDETKIKINNVSTSVPLTYEFNYGNIDQLSVDYGFTSICSMYRNNLNTFAQRPVLLTEAIRNDNSLNKETLFVAECSDKPRLAIFVGFKNDSNDFSHVKIYTAGHFFIIRAEGEPIMNFNNEQHDIREGAYEYPPFQSDFR